MMKVISIVVEVLDAVSQWIENYVQRTGVDIKEEHLYKQRYSELLDYSGMWLKIDRVTLVKRLRTAGIFVSTPAINGVRQQQ